MLICVIVVLFVCLHVVILKVIECKGIIKIEVAENFGHIYRNFTNSYTVINRFLFLSLKGICFYILLLGFLPKIHYANALHINKS